MKKQRTATKAHESRVEALLAECISDTVQILMEARKQLGAQTAMLSEDARNLVLSNALYHFFKVMWFNEANFDEDEVTNNNNIMAYEDFATEIIGKAFFDMCNTLDKWRAPEKM